MKRGTFELVMTIISGICAVGWIARCVKDFTYWTPGSVDGWDIALAVIWSAAFAAHIYRWMNEHKEEQ